MVRFKPLLFLIGILFIHTLAATKGVGVDSKKSGDRPNIILIMADDMGHECLGCYGCLDYKTPHLDMLAAEGIKFTRCYSQPLCTPSRVKIMTGRYNFRNYERFGLLPATEITFGRLLQEAGYSTCMVGKWQLGGDHNSPNEFGFDEYCLQNGIRPAENFDRSTRGRERYWGYPAIVANGELYESKYTYGPDMLNEYAVEFIKKDKERPFFLYYPLLLTHDPFTPTPNSKDGDKSGKRVSEVRYFKDMVEYTDHLVGNIVNALEESGQRENTIIMFTGDNVTTYPVWVTAPCEDMTRVVGIKDRMDKEIRKAGEKTPVTDEERKWREGPITRTDHGDIPGGKDLMTDAGTHVPLIIDWPKHRNDYNKIGNICDDLIDFSDFFTTLIDLSGGELPMNRIVDGISFANRLKGEGGSLREYIFCHYWGFGRDPELAREAIYDARWKLYNNGDFFDLLNDIEESNPLIESEMSIEAKFAFNRLSNAYKELRCMDIPNNFALEFAKSKKK